MIELTKGANTTLVPPGGQATGMVVGVSWDSGSLELDVCAIVCGPDRRTVSDEHFLFWDNSATPDGEVVLRAAPEPWRPPGDRAQVMVGLPVVPDIVDRVVVTLSTIIEGASLSSVRDIVVTVFETDSGSDVAMYATSGEDLTTEACLVLGEIYRHQGAWKFKAVGQGYESGLRGLGIDYGVNIA